MLAAITDFRDFSDFSNERDHKMASVATISRARQLVTSFSWDHYFMEHLSNSNYSLRDSYL